MTRTERVGKGGEALEAWSSPLLFNAGLRSGFTSRKGGVSKPPYHSLNLGLTTKDSRESVLENRRLVESGFKLKLNTLARQVHGDMVLVVKENFSPEEKDQPLPAADAIIGETPGLCLTMFFADCLPIYFWDPAHGAAGLAHAGWRSTVADIARKTVEAMEREYGTLPSDLRVAFGPSIGPCCFEVQSDVENLFVEKFGETTRIRREGKIYVDLWEANALALKKKGVKRENIDIARMCTSCNQETFYSHRRDKGETGRMAGFIKIPG